MTRFLFVRHDGTPTAQFSTVDQLRPHIEHYRRRSDGVLIASDTRTIIDENIPFTEILSGVVACKNYCAIFGLTY